MTLLQITDGKGAEITCLGYKCTKALNEEMLLKLATPQDFKRYKTYMLGDFVRNDSRLTWCTTPDCGRVVMTEDFGAEEIVCTCGKSMCFNCCKKHLTSDGLPHYP